MRAGRRAALVLTGVGLAGVAALGGLAYLAATRSDRLLAAAGRALGRELHIERAGVLVGGTIGVGLWGVRIADDPAFATGEPFVAARTVEMGVRLWPLLRGRLIVDRIVVDQPVVRLVRAADGRLNFDSLRAGARAGRRAQDDDAPAPAHPLAPPFQLALLSLRDGTIRFDDRESRRTLVLDEVTLDAGQPQMGAPMPVTVRARVAGADVRLDGIVSEGVLDLTTDRASYQGTVHADGGTLGPLPVGAADARIALRPPTVTLDTMQVAVLGGAITGRAQLQSGGEGDGFRAEIDGRDLALERLPVRGGRPRPAGRLTLHVALDGPAPGGDTFLPGLRGSGRFEVAEGKIANLRLGGALRDLLGPLLGAEKVERLRTRYPDVFAGDDLPFTAFSGSARLAAGRIRSEDFVLAGASYQAHGSGTLGLDGALDALVRLSASAALTDDLLGHSAARPALVDEQGRLTVPLRVGGTLEHPRVTPDPAFAGQVATALLGGTSLEDVAGTVLQKLLGGKKRRR